MSIPAMTYVVDDPADWLSRASKVYFDCHVVNWESLRGDPPATVVDCEARLVKFAGSATLVDGSEGPAPYAEWGVFVDGVAQACGFWGDNPA